MYKVDLIMPKKPLQGASDICLTRLVAAIKTPINISNPIFMLSSTSSSEIVWEPYQGKITRNTKAKEAEIIPLPAPNKPTLPENINKD